MDNDSEFARMVERNADDIRDTIIRNSRRRFIAKVVALLAAIMVMVIITAIIIGWAKTAVVYAVVIPIAMAYGWWSWKRTALR